MARSLSDFLAQQPDPELVGDPSYSFVLELLVDVEEGGTGEEDLDVLATAIEALDSLEAWTKDIRTRLEKYIGTEGSAE